jgi:hypothetical protein
MMIEELILKELAEIKEQLAYLIKIHEGDPYEYAHPAFDYLQRSKKE